MRRPKDPNDSKTKTGDEQSPPGGRARERVDMFNRQRGIPPDAGSTTEQDDAADSKEPPSDKKKD